MKTWKTGNNITVYNILKGRSNVYLVDKGDIKILVDTSTKRHFKVLLKKLRMIDENLSPDYLFLTHSHFDHAYNAERIKEKFGSKIIIDERDAEALKKGRSQVPSGINLFFNLLVWYSSFSGLDRFPPVECDICVDDIYEIKTRDDSIRMLRTPGHTSGSASLIIDNEIAIAGDTMIHSFTGNLFPPFLNSKMDLINSWRKLLETNCKIFLPGHGAEIPRSLLEKAYAKLVQGS